jgi:hypothetical protein
MADLIHIIKKLIPFATPDTPLIQNLLYCVAIAACALVLLIERYQNYVLERDESLSDTSLHHQGDQETLLDRDFHLEEVIEHVEQEAAEDDDGNSDDNSETEHEREFLRDREQPAANDFQADAAGRPVDNLDPGEGPANAVDRPAPAQRAVGVKKAKSLARKDQRRAYQEFLRSQGDAQRAQDASTAAEREAALKLDQRKRAAAEAEIELRKAREREARREADVREREYEARRRSEPVTIVRRELAERGMCNLWSVIEIMEREGFDLDIEFVEKLLKLAGVLGKNAFTDDGATIILTSKGWVVRVTTQDMKTAYQIAADQHHDQEKGVVPLQSLADALDTVLQQEP